MTKNSTFNRAEHCRRIAGRGGRATVTRHGREHMSAIGVKGFRATAARFRSPREYKVWLGCLGAHTYARHVGLPGWQGKFGHRPPPAPWDPEYTEF